MEKSLIFVYHRPAQGQVDASILVEHPYAPSAARTARDSEPGAPAPGAPGEGGSWLHLQPGPRVAVLPGDAPTVQEQTLGAGTRRQVYGLLGLLELGTRTYLLTIEERRLAGSIQRHKLWRILRAGLLELGSAGASPPSAANATTLQAVMRLLNSGLLYYSKTYDLTHSLQHQAVPASSAGVVDDRYYFNHHASLHLLAVKEARPWCTKVIAGFAGSVDVTTADSAILTATLLSRVSNRRMGTRYLCRGLSPLGHAANSVETEQLLFPQNYHDDPSISAFVQVRGSAPAMWRQELDLSYRPSLYVEDSQEPKCWGAVTAHFRDLLSQYPPTVSEAAATSTPGKGATAERSGPDPRVLCINLLDTEGFEGPLSAEFERNVGRFGDAHLEYESFPVSKWCRGMKYENLAVLLSRVEARLGANGFFHARGKVPALVITTTASSSRASTATRGWATDPAGLRVLRFQAGVMRVSCLDSLDRTNLVCALFAKTMLIHQSSALLAREHALPLSLERVHPFDAPSLRELTAMWADNGDAISLLYAGTGALKADVTRTGKRQLRGNLDDGVNALTRYYLNNFDDGRKQDAIHLLLGKKPDTIDDVTASKRSEARRDASLAGRVVTALQSWAPTTISTPWDFVLAMVLCFWILVLVRLLHLDGRRFVTRAGSGGLVVRG